MKPETVPLAAKAKHVGTTALRLMLNDGITNVSLSNEGATTCLNSKCLGARKETCEHRELALALTKDDLDRLPHSMLSHV